MSALHRFYNSDSSDDESDWIALYSQTRRVFEAQRCIQAQAQAPLAQYYCHLQLAQSVRVARSIRLVAFDRTRIRRHRRRRQNRWNPPHLPTTLRRSSYTFYNQHEYCGTGRRITEASHQPTPPYKLMIYREEEQSATTTAQPEQAFDQREQDAINQIINEDLAGAISWVTSGSSTGESSNSDEDLYELDPFDEGETLDDLPS